jgi:hypothetical protein
MRQRDEIGVVQNRLKSITVMIESSYAKNHSAMSFS